MKKIAIVTGASSGMGREAAFQLVDKYAGLEEIWLIARREDRLEEVKDKLPVPSRTLAIDLTDVSNVAKLQSLLESEKPNVKILVNAAGFGKLGDVDELPLQDESGMIQVNCGSLTAITRTVLPYMSDKSRIINFASAAAFLPQPGFSVYAATKSYVYSFSRALNVELSSRSIAVTAVCPGPVNTEFFTVAEEGTHTASPFKKMFMAKPQKVVKKALRDSAMGKSVSVYGIPMKLAGLCCKFLPQGALMKLMQGVYSRGNESDGT